MVCHPTKFGCKKISSSINIYIGNSHIFDYMCPHCDLELEDRKSSFFGDDGSMMMHYHIKWRKYHWDEHSLEFWTFPVTLTLTITEESNLFTRQSSSWLGAIRPNCFSCKMSSSSGDVLESLLWWHDPSLWPWPWRQQTNIFGRQFGSWWCITVPSLVVA